MALLAVGVWLFVRRRRRRATLAGTAASKQVLPHAARDCPRAVDCAAPQGLPVPPRASGVAVVCRHWDDAPRRHRRPPPAQAVPSDTGTSGLGMFSKGSATGMNGTMNGMNGDPLGLPAPQHRSAGQASAGAASAGAISVPGCPLQSCRGMACHGLCAAGVCALACPQVQPARGKSCTWLCICVRSCAMCAILPTLMLGTPAPQRLSLCRLAGSVHSSGGTGLSSKTSQLEDPNLPALLRNRNSDSLQARPCAGLQLAPSAAGTHRPAADACCAGSGAGAFVGAGQLRQGAQR